MEKLSFYLKLLINFFMVMLMISIMIKMVTVGKMILASLDLIALSNLEYNNFLLFIEIIGTVLLTYLFSLFYRFRNTIYETGSNSYFSDQNGRAFKSVGKGLIYYSALRFVIKLAEKFYHEMIPDQSFAYNSGKILGTTFLESVPILIIALFLLIIAHLIKDGYSLKLENDLTV